MRILLLVTCGAAVAFLACGQPVVCDPVQISAVSVCLAPDAGSPRAGTAFEVQVQPNSFAEGCQVSVNGSAVHISLFNLAGGACGGSGNAAAPQPTNVKCSVPALDAGSYSFDSVPATTFSLPFDGGIPACP